jgi:hypothetical protein
LRENFIRVLLVALSLTVIVSASYLKNPDVFKEDIDTRSSIAMAEGHIEGVTLHHARRILHPWVVSRLKTFTGTDNAFIIVGRVSLFFFLFFIISILTLRFNLTLVSIIAVIFSPILFRLYRDLYLQPLFFCFLSSIYWFLLLYKKYLFSIFLLLLMLFTRDESIIILFSFIAALTICALKGKKVVCYYYIMLTISILAFSWVIIGNLTKNNVNIHHLPNFLFQTLRIPMYSFENITGLRHWLSTYSNSPDYTHPPFFVFDAPSWIRNNSLITKIGIYEFDKTIPLQTILILLSTFGTAPAIIFYFLKNRIIRIRENAIFFNTIMFSGLSLFVLSLGLSSSGWRYCINSWPVFLITFPILLNEIRRLKEEIYWKILLCYIISAWLPFIWVVSSVLQLFLLVILEIVFSVYSWRMLSILNQVITLRKDLDVLLSQDDS